MGRQVHKQGTSSLFVSATHTQLPPASDKYSLPSSLCTLSHITNASLHSALLHRHARHITSLRPRPSECDAGLLIRRSANIISTQDSDGLLLPVSELYACRNDLDCALDESCVSSVCRVKCTQSSDCLSIETCLGSVCRSLCNEDDPADKTCGAREECMDFICRPKCTHGRTCPEGFGCWNGACVQYCHRDQHCSQDGEDPCKVDFESTKVKGK